jgi:hypothetical protein
MRVHISGGAGFGEVASERRGYGARRRPRARHRAENMLREGVKLSINRFPENKV